MPAAPAEYRRPRPRRNDGSLSLALSLKRRGHEIRVKLLLHRMDRTYRPTRRYAWPPDSAATEFTIGTIPFNSTSCSFIIRSVPRRRPERVLAPFQPLAAFFKADRSCVNWTG